MLALVHEERGSLEQAKIYFERALAILEAAYGPDDIKVASALMNLGGLERLRGSYADAVRYLERALAIRERVLGPEHAEVARVLGNLGIDAPRRRLAGRSAEVP